MFSGKKKEKVSEAYVSDQAEKTSETDVSKAIENEKNIEDKITKSGFLERYAALGKLMISMLKDYRKGRYHNVPWFTIGSITFSLLYVLNPLDIIPDFIPGLGYLDDLSVFTFALKFVESDLHNYLDWKKGHPEEK